MGTLEGIGGFMLTFVEKYELRNRTWAIYQFYNNGDGLEIEIEFRLCMSDMYAYMTKPYYNIELGSSHIPGFALQHHKYYDEGEITEYGHETIKKLLDKLMAFGKHFVDNKEMFVGLIQEYKSKLQEINDNTNLLHKAQYLEKKKIGKRMFKEGLLTQKQYQHKYLKSLHEQFEICKKIKSDLLYLYDKKLAELTNNAPSVRCELIKAAINYFYPESSSKSHCKL